MSPDLLERHRILRLLLGLLIFVLGIFLSRLTWSILVTLGDVILLFFLAWIIAFILEPVSLLLQKRGLKRVFAVSLIYVALLVVVSGIIVLTVPSIEYEVQLLASEITAALSPGNLTNLNNSFVSMLRHIGFSKQNAHSIVNSISDQIPQMALSLTSGAVNTTTQFFAHLLGILFDTFLVMIISFYMMLDGDRLVESFVRRLPPVWISDVRLFQSYVEQIFGGFFRAQLTIGLIYGILTWVILMFFQQANGLLVESFPALSCSCRLSGRPSRSFLLFSSYSCSRPLPMSVGVCCCSSSSLSSRSRSSCSFSRRAYSARRWVSTPCCSSRPC